MKKLFFIFVFLVLQVNFIYSQENPTQPLIFNPNILVYGQGMPHEFLPFLNDTASQVLFNPARGNLSRNFIYGTYEADFSLTNSNYYYYYTIPIRYLNPFQENEITTSRDFYENKFAYDKHPSFSLASLLNILNSKWLLIFTHGISNSKEIPNSSYNSVTSDSINYRLSNSSTESNNFYNQSLTTFKLSKINNYKFGNLSFGIFGVIYKDELSLNVKNSYYSKSRNNSYYYKNYSYNNVSEQKDKLNNNPKITLGVEGTFSNNNLDLISSFSYFNNEIDKFAGKNKINFRYDSTWSSSQNKWYYSKQESKENQKVESTLKVSGYIFYTYFQHRINLFGNEESFFVSVNYNNGSGDSQNKLLSDNDAKYYTQDTLLSKTLTNEKQESSFESFNKTIFISIGYSIKSTFDNFDLLAGIKLSGYNEKSLFPTFKENYNYEYFQLTKIENNITSYLFNIPIFVSYSPENWISIYGGFQFYYGYNSKREISSIDKVVNMITYKLMDVTDTSVNEQNNWESYKSTFLGLTVKHKSGFHLQIAFDEDLTNFRDWNISLGYHF